MTEGPPGGSCGGQGGAPVGWVGLSIVSFRFSGGFDLVLLRNRLDIQLMGAGAIRVWFPVALQGEGAGPGLCKGEM